MSRKRATTARKRVAAAAADPDEAASHLRHFRRWNHVTVDLAGNRIRCDCALAAELQTVDMVLTMIGGGGGGNGSETGSESITSRWRRLNCCEPVEHAGLSVGTFVDSMAPTLCRPDEVTRNDELAADYGVCTASQSVDDLGESTTLNCSGKQLVEFPPRAAISADVAVKTVDVSRNRLRVVRAERLRALFPSLRVLLLHDNLITSLPASVDDVGVTPTSGPTSGQTGRPRRRQSGSVSR